MRKKLQDKMFELSYIFELIISVIIGIAVLIFAIQLLINMCDINRYISGNISMVEILDAAIILAIGAELIKMLCKHTPETVIEVLAFALAHHLIVGHATPLENLIMVLAISALFAVRRFLLKRQDVVETPDGFIKSE